MEREAIKKIENMALMANEAIQPQTDTPTIALPNDWGITSLEGFQECRNSYRGTFKTRMIDDFCGYVNQQIAAKIFINQESMGATAYFDLGDDDHPGFGEHKATIDLKYTAAALAMKMIDGEQRRQSQIAEFMEDWVDSLSAIDKEGNDMPMAKAIRSVRNVSTDKLAKMESKVESFSVSRSAVESIDVNADEDNQLPAFVDFKMTPYSCMGEYTFRMRLSFVTDTSQSTVKFILRSIRLDEKLEEIAEDFSKMINDKLTLAGAEIYKGTFTP